MNPHERFCHNQDCRAYGREGEGHIVIHSKKERRYRCKRCRRTFTQTTGTALYRLHKPKELVFTVITLLAHGCPLQAICAAFGLDERTVARWEREAGMQCQRVHERIVEAGRVEELGQVQADELRVRVVGGVMWLAGALAVESRLWLGGVVSLSRDRDLIRALLSRVRACGSVRAVLLCTDGLASYPKQAIHLFREPLRTGKVGRPRLILPEGVMIAQVIKRYAKRRVVGVVRRVVTGISEAVAARLRATQGSEASVINTAYIERLQATFRSRLAALVRRSRTPVRLRKTLEAGMWLVGTCYNFCWTHTSMRREREGSDPPGGKWVESTPAQVAGLTDHHWSVEELLSFPVPPAQRPKWRGRRPKWLVEAAHAA